MSDEPKTYQKAPQAHVDRRRHPRVRLSVTVEVDSVTSFLGRSADVSPSGICLVVAEELPEGSLVDLEFQIPSSDESIEVLGEIRWTHPLSSQISMFSYGIEFLDLGDTDRRRLSQLVQRLAPDSG